jgi:hypothetical protein
MRVSELINLLKEVDQTKEIYLYLYEEIFEISGVDELSDRVDINFIEREN